MVPGILAIVGPTASGKTDLGLRLAKEQSGEIISVDSRQTYKFLSIGTAKPTGKWASISQSPRQNVSRGLSIDPPLTPAGDDVFFVEGIPYHLIDFLEPSEAFSAAQFVHLATEKVAEIRARGKTPIFVGGTGLYFKALTEGLATLPPANPEIRARLTKEATDEGREHLHRRLQKVDSEAAAKIPANNIQRLVRALEVYEVTGKPISQWHQEHQSLPSPIAPRLTYIGLDPGREELVRRIETRCRAMMKEGMIEETERLLKKGFTETCPALTGLGYPRIISLIKGTLSKEDCLKLLIQDTRQYAKRQRTWFRHQLPVEWKK